MNFEAVVAHGYTLRDLSQLARIAASKVNVSRLSMAFELGERYDQAWSGIAEYLVTAVERPTPGELVIIGRQGVYRGVRDDYRHHGIADRNPVRGLGSARGFAMYWLLRRAYPAPEEDLVQRVALAQIWPRLRQTDREALWALAVHDEYGLAAAALGLRSGAFRARIIAARQRFLALWHEGETPSRPYAIDRRVRNDGQRATRDPQAVAQWRRRRKAR